MDTGRYFSNIRLIDQTTGPIQAKLIVASKSLVVVGLLVVIFLINGCASGSTINNFEISAPHETTAPASVIKANVGIYYDPTLTDYVHIQSFATAISTMNVGQESIGLFNSAIPQVFEQTRLIDKLPPYDILRSDMDGIVEPRLDYVSWKMFFRNDVELFHVEYTFMFYTSEGVPISNWTIVGLGSSLKDQLADAAQKFVSGFNDAPETKTFREYLENKRVGKLSFDAKDIEVNAKISENYELGLPLKVGGVLPVQVTVKNNTDGEITGRGFDVRLIDSCNKRLAPAFPMAVVSRFEYMAATGASDPAMAGLLGSLVMMGSISGQDSNRIEARKLQARHFDKSRLKEVTLAKGESIQGTLYFVLPYNVTEMHEARLSFWFIDPSVANGVIKEVSLSGIDYLRSPQLEQQRNSLVEGGAVSPYTSYNSLGASCSVPDSREAKSPSNSLMTAVEMRAVIPGNTSSGISEKGNKYHVYHDPNGTLKGKLDGGRYDSGTWVITDVGEHCHKWKKWRKGRQECFLMYSIEGNKYRTKSGSILVIQEGDQRSKKFLTVPNEQTALIVPPVPDDQPAMDSGITDTAEFGLTGTYTSNVRRMGSADLSCFNQRSAFQIELKQENNIIKGKFLSGVSGGIEGTLVGNKVKFIWYTAKCNDLNEGEWTMSSGGASLEGYVERPKGRIKWKAQKPVNTNTIDPPNSNEQTAFKIKNAASSKKFLSEEQLLSNIVGNTLTGKNNLVGKWAEYYEPSKVGEKKGNIYGKAKKPYWGQWEIDGSLMCFDYGVPAIDFCSMLVLEGNSVTWHDPNGDKNEDWSPARLVPGNPYNL